ncbi:hypothetical protein B0H14DRAFT_2571133 [Mycena olivaceomarginata]|nr:hypothetical protein B0H14DRAFT_2571133 [Mycena olivaceomarginata]
MHDDDELLTPSEPDEAPPLPEELAELVSEARKKRNVAAANLQQTKTAHEKAQWTGHKDNIRKVYEDTEKLHLRALEDLAAAEKKLQTVQLSAGELTVKLADLGPVDEAGAADARAKAAADTKAAEEAADDAKTKAEAVTDASGKAADEAATDAKAAAAVAEEAATDTRAKMAADTKAAEPVAAAEEAAAEARAKATAAKEAAAEEAGADTRGKAVDAAAAAADAKAKATAAEEVAADTRGKAVDTAAAAADAKAKATVVMAKEGSADAKDQAAADKAAVVNEKKGKKRKKSSGSGEDAVECGLQAINDEDSDVEEGSVRKKPQLENEMLLRQLVDTANYRLQNPGVSKEEEQHLMATKGEAEIALSKLATDAETTEKKGTREKKSLVPPKMIEDKWVFSFQPEAADLSGEKYFNQRMPEEWREKLEGTYWRSSWCNTDLRPEEIWKELVKFNNTAPEKKYSISISNRRLLRKVAEILPTCATMSRMTTKHILSDINNFTHCRFHEEKRTTVQAKQVDGWTSSKFVVDGVALVAFEKQKQKKGKKGGKSRLGFLDCGCDEDVVLSDFMWFKTWKVKSTNPKFPVEESMKNNVFSACHRAFFSQAFSSGTCLQIEDFFSTDPAWGTPEYETCLRSIQVERIMAQLNALKELGPKKGSVMVEMPGDDERMEGIES